MNRHAILKGAALLAASTLAPVVMAADHADGPAAKADKTTDIADLFTWVKGTKTYLVMDLGKDMHVGDKFSNVAQYVFHTTSAATYGAATKKSLDVICTFNVAQTIQCWAGKEYVTGNASAAAGITSEDAKVKVFAGLRNDPFFFNLTGFQDAALIVHGAATGTPGLTFDRDGCPALDGQTSALLVNTLRTRAADGGPAVDTFAPFNVLSIVLEIDTTVLTAGGPILGVWASTNK